MIEFLLFFRFSRNCEYVDDVGKSMQTGIALSSEAIIAIYVDGNAIIDYFIFDAWNS